MQKLFLAFILFISSWDFTCSFSKDSRLQTLRRGKDSVDISSATHRPLLDDAQIRQDSRGRRAILATFSAIIVGMGVKPQAGYSVMENRQDVFKVGQELTVEQARKRYKEGQASLDYLLENWDDVVANGGGDNVRRYIGTVGTTSGLYGIQKVMKVLQDDADDIVEYTETMNEVNACINGVDGSAYMAIFVVTSTSQTPPEKYFNDAKTEAKRAKQAMIALAEQLKL